MKKDRKVNYATVSNAKLKDMAASPNNRKQAVRALNELAKRKVQMS